MRQVLRFLAPLAIGACVAGLTAAQGPADKAAAAPAKTKAAAPAPDPRKMEELLRQWEEQSGATKSMVAEFDRVDKSVVWATTTEYKGRAILRSPNLACLNFDKVVDPKKPATFHERIICSGDKVYQFVMESKQIFVYPLDANDRQRALDEGPLPFLFNMKAADAKRRYRMILQGESKTTYLVGIVPLEDIDKEAFRTAWVWLNRETFLPDKLELVDPKNGKDKKTFTFTRIVRNANVKDSYFDGEALSKEMLAKKWDRVENPGPDAPATARRGPVPKNFQPAQRPATKTRQR